MTEPLKVSLIGTGSISCAHLLVYQLAPDRVRLNVVRDIRADATRLFAADAQMDEYRQILKAAEQAGVTFMVALAAPPRSTSVATMPRPSVIGE